MVNKKEAEEAVKAAFQNEDRPTLGDNVHTSEAVLSHNWQEGSPAVDMRYAGVANSAVNVVSANLAAKEVKEEEKAKPISQAEYDRRIGLDVSDPAYINESLGHVKVK